MLSTVSYDLAGCPEQPASPKDRIAASRVTDGVGLKEAPEKRFVERGMLWSVIGFASALVILLVLGEAGVLPVAALRTVGTILIWLCVALSVGATIYAVQQLQKAKTGSAAPLEDASQTRALHR